MFVASNVFGYVSIRRHSCRCRTIVWWISCLRLICTLLKILHRYMYVCWHHAEVFLTLPCRLHFTYEYAELEIYAKSYTLGALPNFKFIHPSQLCAALTSFPHRLDAVWGVNYWTAKRKRIFIFIKWIFYQRFARCFCLLCYDVFSRCRRAKACSSVKARRLLPCRLVALTLRREFESETLLKQVAQQRRNDWGKFSVFP